MHKYEKNVINYLYCYLKLRNNLPLTSDFNSDVLNYCNIQSIINLTCENKSSYLFEQAIKRNFIQSVKVVIVITGF